MVPLKDSYEATMLIKERVHLMDGWPPKATIISTHTCSICGKIHPDKPCWFNLTNLDNRMKIAIIAPLTLRKQIVLQ